MQKSLRGGFFQILLCFQGLLFALIVCFRGFCSGGSICSFHGCKLLGSRLCIGIGGVDLLGLGLVVVVGAGKYHHLIVLTQAHHPHAGAVAALQRDLVGVQTDDDALLTAQQHVIHIVHDLHGGNLVAAHIVVADALAAACGDAVGVDIRAASLAVLGHGQDGGVLTADADTHDLVALGQLDGAHAVAAAAHGTGILFIKADGLTVAGCNDEHIVAGGQSCPGQCIPLVQGNADQATLADVGVLLQRGALDEALFRDHGHETALIGRILALAEHVGDLFALGQLQQVHDVGALAGAAALGDGVALDAEQAATVGDKEHIVVGKATIQCESELGKGSVFTVALPISEEAYPEEWLEYSEPKMEEASLRESVPLEGTNPVPENLRQTLLFVEDNEDLCRYLMNAFQTDYRVVIAKNGKVGLEKAMEILPDVIVSDVMMPVMNGIECCEALKTDERTAHIPVILLTALAEERQQLEGYGAGADDYLPKPFSLAVLKAKIKNLLKRSERLKLYFRDRFDLRTPEQTVANPDKEFVSKVTRVVLAHLQDPEFDVELFCSEMAMSRASLFRKLKSTTGCSASSFTRNIRIKRAAELLGQHAYSIGEVAAQVGFSDPNYFTRCFKEIYGITPSEFIQTSPSSQDSHSPLASSGK